MANFQALSSNGAAKPQAVATCNLVAGWFNVPAGPTRTRTRLLDLAGDGHL